MTAYCTTVHKKLCICDLKAAQRESNICSANGKELSKVFMTICSKRLQKLVFMLSDKDCIYDPKKVSTAPVDYALKGAFNGQLLTQKIDQ